MERVLDAKGHLLLPAQGWPGWSEEQLGEARDRLFATLAAIEQRRPLDVFEDQDGTLRVYPRGAMN